MTRPSKPTGSPSYPKRKAQARLKPFTPSRTKQMLDKQEVKFLDTAISTLVDTTTEVINNLCLVTQGDGPSNRDGQIIRIKSVRIVGRVSQVPAAAAVSAPIFYLWLVQDKQPNGTALTVTDFLTSATANLALPNTSFEWRFKTITKIVIPLTSTAGVTTAYNNVAMPVEYFYKFKTPLEVRYSGNAGTVADQVTNNLTLVAGAADSDDTITFTGTARIRFTG